MKTILLLVSATLLSASAACAQFSDDLTTTLPNGKVLTFATPEQKAKFEAARQRVQTAAVSAPSGATSAAAPAHMKVGSSLDAPQSSGTGIGNISAPIFTARYYLGAPETWVGKKVTLSVAYLEPRGEDRTDGMAPMWASTWNRSNNNVYLGQDTGGMIEVLASQKAALKLQILCGSSIQWLPSGWLKTSMVKGTFQRTGLKNASPDQQYMVVLDE